MPYIATIHLLPPPPIEALRAPKGSRARRSPGDPKIKFAELMDRVNATLISAAGAPAGIQSATWGQLVREHPDIQDPFARVVQAAPDIADAASRTIYDKILGVLEEEGLSDEVASMTSALESHYRYEDSAGNVCTYDRDTDTFRSPQGLPCRLVKAAGGGASVIKNLVLKQLDSPKAKVRAAFQQGVQEALADISHGPQRLWSKLTDAWKVGVLLTGLGAAASRVTELKVAKGELTFGIAGVGRIEINKGKLKQLALSLPKVTLKRLQIKAGGAVKDGRVESANVALVVPVRRTTLTASAEVETQDTGARAGHVDLAAKRTGKRGTTVEAGARLDAAPGVQSTTVRAATSVPIAKGRGTVRAASATTFAPGQGRVPTAFTASVAAPINKTRTISMAAGVTGAVTTGGGRVELASSPAVTVEMSGRLPTLNRRLRKAQQARDRTKEQRASELADAKSEEAALIAKLQGKPAPVEADRYAMLRELDQVRSKISELDIGSANRRRGTIRVHRQPLPGVDRTLDGDKLVMGLIAAGLVYQGTRGH